MTYEHDHIRVFIFIIQLDKTYHVIIFIFNTKQHCPMDTKTPLSYHQLRRGDKMFSKK